MPRNATEVGQRRSYVYRGEKYPSVTTLLKCWPMEWAIAYGAKHVAERAMSAEHMTRLARIDYGEPEYDETLKWLKKAPYERRDAAADAGTIRHGYLEDRLNGFDMPEGELSPAELAVEKFLAVYKPDPLFVECQVVSVSERYAGSADAFVSIYGKRYVLDLKTGKNTATDHKARLQLAAYRYAEVIFEDDRDIGPVPQVDGALILSIPREDPRSWQVIEVDAGHEVYRRFLDFSRAFRWYDEHKDTAVGELMLPQIEEGAA